MPDLFLIPAGHNISTLLDMLWYHPTMSEYDVVPMFRALGDPTRARIFEFLCARCCPVAVEEDGEVRPINGATVGDVCCHITGSEKFSSTISFHLRELRLAHLITAEKSGKFMICAVRPDALEALKEYLNQLPQPQPCPPTNITASGHSQTITRKANIRSL